MVVVVWFEGCAEVGVVLVTVETEVVTEEVVGGVLVMLVAVAATAAAAAATLSGSVFPRLISLRAASA